MTVEQLSGLCGYNTWANTLHRGQVTLLLRQLGHVPPSTDFQDYLVLARAAAAKAS